MGVLAPRSAHARPSTQPPIDTSGNFSAHAHFVRSHIRSFGTLGQLLKITPLFRLYLLWVGILLFLWVRTPCKILESYNNIWKYPPLASVVVAYRFVNLGFTFISIFHLFLIWIWVWAKLNKTAHFVYICSAVCTPLYTCPDTHSSLYSYLAPAWPPKCCQRNLSNI